MSESHNPESEAQATQVVEAFMAALNSGDNRALFDAMHVPHIRLSGNGVAIHLTKEELELEYLKGFTSRAGETWHHTDLNWVRPLHSSEDKAHLYIQWTRYDNDGAVFATHQALWIMTREDGRWGAQARSSFAP